ncbi:MAG: Na+/H+ antiporter [Proteobacteria bacterium]|nr:Na+/H+ antiporter [Pseudomonadota bacterium]
MEQIETFVILFATIVLVGHIFNKSIIPISLLLVITGMILSLFPVFPHVTLNPKIVLDIFLPILVYQISAFFSLREFKKNLRPISLLSIGHVIFITMLVAWIIHALIPQLGWPLAFVLGAVVSPPDSVAIVSIAEKIRMPSRIVTILEGEGMLNDAAALILFRFALVAVVTHEFSAIHAISAFFAVVIGETLYGFALGYLIGELRLKIDNSMLQLIASLLTPFIAYIPAERLGGSGVLATVITGLVIGHRLTLRISPEFRLIYRTIWPAITFTIQSILFLLVGLNMESIMRSISSIPLRDLLLYGTSVTLAVIIGRFFWVYVAVYYLPRALFPSIRKKDPYAPWQYPFVTSWAGMRGAISLAAAFAIPFLPSTINSANPRALIIFLVFCVITATLLLQGLTLPWILKVIGIKKYGQTEKHNEYLSELNARLEITKAVLHWLPKYKMEVKDNTRLVDEINWRIEKYKILKIQLEEGIEKHNGVLEHDEKMEAMNEVFLVSQVIEVQRAKLLELWYNEKISLVTRNKLLENLDYRTKRLLG